MKILKRHKNKTESIGTIFTAPKIRKLETTVLIKEVPKRESMKNSPRIKEQICNNNEHNICGRTGFEGDETSKFIRDIV
jgi:hypothetical protein